MAWLAVHKNGCESIFDNKPEKTSEYWIDMYPDEEGYDTEIELPKGSIKKLIGRDLDWNDEPVELKVE